MPSQESVMSHDLTTSVERLARARRVTHPNWHAGQAAYSALEHLRPDLAAAVRGSDIDPSHGPGRLPRFYAWLQDPGSGPPAR